MANEINTMMRSLVQKNTNDIKIARHLDNTILAWSRDKPPRFGLHLSDLKAPFKGKGQYCYRQHVLGNFYDPAPEGEFPLKTIRIWLEGWYIHHKWQMIFQKGGFAIDIEKTHLHPLFKIYYTPDITASFPDVFNGETIVVEIKSMNNASYTAAEKETDPYRIHQDGYKQGQLYMYLTGLKHAMLLLDNKDTSFHREITFDFDPAFVAPYAHRINIQSQMNVTYANSNQIPIKVCGSKDDPRAQTCPMRHVCWLQTKDQRSQYLRKDEEFPQEQINASLHHQKEI